jgi:hypothetical protein
VAASASPHKPLRAAYIIKPPALPGVLTPSIAFEAFAVMKYIIGALRLFIVYS